MKVFVFIFVFIFLGIGLSQEKKTESNRLVTSGERWCQGIGGPSPKALLSLSPVPFISFPFPDTTVNITFNQYMKLGADHKARINLAMFWSRAVSYIGISIMSDSSSVKAMRKLVYK